LISNIIKLSFYTNKIRELLTSVVFFAQILSVQILYYPLILLNFLRPNIKVFYYKRFWFGLLILTLSFVSLVVRDAPSELIFKSMHFYFGIIIVVMAFSFNKKFKLFGWHLYVFAGVIIYEYIVIKIFGGPTFIQLMLADIDPSFAASNKLVKYDDTGRLWYVDTSRPLGPTINTSISACMAIIAVFFIYTYYKIYDFSFKEKVKNFILLFLLFLAFLFCKSMTSYVVFAFLVLIIFGRNMFKTLSTMKITKNLLLFIIIIITIILAILLSIPTAYEVFDTILGAERYNYENTIWIIKDKFMWHQLTMKNFLWGQNLAPKNIIWERGPYIMVISDYRPLGGDSILLNFVETFGLLLVIFFFIYIFTLCKKEFRWLLLAGCIGSLHYGVIFSMPGKIFFGALIANSIHLGKNKNNKV